MSLKKFTQDPDEVLDYTIDWSEWLAEGDTITEVTATPASGITVDSTSFTVSSTTIWVSGGAAGQRYDISVHVVTNGGREGDRSITIEIKEK
ncbi:hypothetical protein SEA_ARCHIE_22 [Mycobacterium phage Archie]|uniref:Minor tail protein n=2 Tax=Faithunavirus TaxID=2948705 RepID=A0A0M4RBJ6_9CAUD|nr:hypothetical protein AVU85_gp022 [Mycobacterium phage Archie]YP_010013120.1 hypothetical protein J4T98_gp022 [Mycobacterium phage Tourach]ALF00328.1 hypothetical protein SEA_ARCHIE_22 [Mycobacterium phage Archie]QFG14261.1 hypothetical protein PBI_TOURACH_22 [Mycobacterium phage Tourach]